MSSREYLLQQWLLAQLHIEALDLQVVSGDASFRRYFRIRLPGQNTSLIAVDSPPDKESNAEFVQIARTLFAKGFAVPEVKALDMEQGFLLLSDLGNRLLLPELNEGTVNDHYQQAMQTLVALQSHVKTTDLTLPLYDGKRLHAEMALFTEWFIPHYLEYPLKPDQQQTLQNAFDCLANSALEQPVVFVHRDYHARNLMLLDNQQLAMIDFQDAVWGPMTYDLVSVLRDCYVRWPRQQTLAWASDYFRAAVAAGLLPASCTEGQFLRWFEWMGVQRHLKATGIFARLNFRDHKPVYLGDIPRTYSYMLETTAAYPELAAMNSLLKDLAAVLVVKNPKALPWLETFL